MHCKVTFMGILLNPSPNAADDEYYYCAHVLYSSAMCVAMNVKGGEACRWTASITITD